MTAMQAYAFFERETISIEMVRDGMIQRVHFQNKSAAAVVCAHC